MAESESVPDLWKPSELHSPFRKLFHSGRPYLQKQTNDGLANNAIYHAARYLLTGGNQVKYHAKTRKNSDFAGDLARSIMQIYRL